MLEETRINFKDLYEKKKDTIEWMLSYGNDFEMFMAKKIRDVALGCI